MPVSMKPSRSPTPGGRKTGVPEDGTPKFRAKIMGLSAVAEQNALSSAASSSPPPPLASPQSSMNPGNALPTATTAVLQLERDERGNLLDQKDLVAQLQDELARRQESYVRRERQYKVRIGELEAQLSDSRAKKSKQSALDASMDRIRQLHRSILDSVGQVQDRTAKILQEQEKDLLRAFRARLYSVQEELESEKNKTDDGASAWIEKSKQLETEVEWTKELADRLDRLNQSLTRENQRLKTQFSTQESDREFLVKQLVGVKKDNVTLRNEYDALRRQLDQLTEESASGVGTGGSLSHHNHHSLMAASTSALPKVHAGMSAGSNGSRPNTAMGLHLGNNNGVSGGAMAASLAETDNRYKEIIKRLKRLLEVERRNLQQVRTSYKLELQNRTELETILKECIQDVRSERAAVSNQQTASQSVLPTVGGGGSSNGLKRPTSSMDGRLSASERQGLIDRLLEKERLLTLLTAKAFPIRHPASGKTKGDPLISGDTVSSDDLAKLLADVPSFSPTPSS